MSSISGGGSKEPENFIPTEVGGAAPADPSAPRVNASAQSVISKPTKGLTRVYSIEELTKMSSSALETGNTILATQSSNAPLVTKMKQAKAFDALYHKIVESKKAADAASSYVLSALSWGKEKIYGEAIPIEKLNTLNNQIQEGLFTQCKAKFTADIGAIYSNQEYYRDPHRFEENKQEIEAICRELRDYEDELFTDMTLSIEDFYGLENLTSATTIKRLAINAAKALLVPADQRDIATEVEAVFKVCNESITKDDLEDETLQGPFRAAGNKTKVGIAMEMFSKQEMEPLRSYLIDTMDRDDKIAFIKQLVKRVKNHISKDSSPSLCMLIQRTIAANNPMHRGNLLTAFPEIWDFLN